MTKLRINLYLDEFRPQQEKYSLVHLALLLLLLAALMAGWGYWQYQQTQHALQAVRMQQQTIEDTQQQLTTLRTRMAAHKADPQLATKAEQLQTLLQNQQAIVQQLSQRDLLRSDNFADWMLALAQRHQPGLWLTQIQISERSVLIEGASQKTELVPQWLAGFQGQAVLERLSVAEVRIEQDPSLPRWNFRIDASRRAAQGAGHE